MSVQYNLPASSGQSGMGNRSSTPSEAASQVETLSYQAARWLTDLNWDRIPSEAVENTKLRILDVIGVMLAAKQADVVSRVRKAATRYDSGTGAHIIGFPEETSLSAAAMINGVMSAILEFDDTHIESAIHATAPSVAVAVPLAQSLGSSGRELIASVLIGSELTCRIGRIGPRFHELGLHPTGIFGIFGSVYSQSRLLKLSPEQIVNAIGIAGSMSSGTMASWEEGDSAKSLQVGLAASSGVRAVALAREGLTGPSSLFESSFGFFRAHVQKEYDFRFSALTDDLGSKWESLNIASKAYPSAFVMHPFVDAVLELKEQHGLQPEDIAEITCFVSEFTLNGVCEPRESKLRPRTTWHARISLQHMVSEALVTGRMDKTSFSEANLRDPTINALSDKIQCSVNPQDTDPTKSSAAVRIRLRNGSILEHEIKDMRGTASNPITRDDYISKFTTNAEGSIPSELIEKTVRGILDLDKANDAREVLKSLSL